MSFKKIVSVCEVICDAELMPVLAWLMEDSMIKENCKKRAGISGFPNSVNDNNEYKTTIQLLFLPDGCNFTMQYGHILQRRRVLFYIVYI